MVFAYTIQNTYTIIERPGKYLMGRGNNGARVS